MGLIASTLKVPTSVRNFGVSVPVWQNGQAQLPSNNYQTYAREGYMKNGLVFACIQERATSAAEPRLRARIDGKWSHEARILSVLNRPNPFMDRFELFATTIIHQDLHGNAYWLKVRSQSMRMVETWILRPDRVKVVPSRTNYISHYTYDVGGGDFIEIPANDIIHFQGAHDPLNDWYGMSLLRPGSGRIDIDNYMADFVKGAFENGGMPGAVLTIKQKVTQEEKNAIRDRFRGQFGGPAGWHELLILDNTESSYTPMSMTLGQRGLVVPELDEIEEARICSVFGVPQSLVGTRTSYQNGGYANKRAEEQHFWTGTLMPLYRKIAGTITRSLVEEFPTLQEIDFDYSDVMALRKDEAELHAMIREDARAGLIEVELARELLGYPRTWAANATFLVPSATPPMAGSDFDNPQLPAPALEGA